MIPVGATASSTYDNNDADYGPKFAVDGYSDTTGRNFFHSTNAGGYPWLAAVIGPTAQDVVSVTLKSRCDADGWGNNSFTLVVR